jgi:hypothetical protein
VHANSGAVVVLQANDFANNNAISGGCDLHVGPAANASASELFNNTFHAGVACTSLTMVAIQNTMPFRCEPGHYMTPTPTTLRPADFTGCQFACPAGTVGNSPDLTSPECNGPCPSGHYCVSGTALPVACPAGRYLEPPPVVGTSSSSCLPCAASRPNPS